MMKAILPIFSFFIWLSLSNPAGAFAFNVVKGNDLVDSDNGIPVIWPEQSVSIGIAISQTYRQYVVEAMTEWNDTGANVLLVEGQNAGSPCVSNDKLNSISFSLSTCSTPWGDAIGLTYVKGLIMPQGDAYISEADIVIRSFSSEPNNQWTTPGDVNNSPTASCYMNVQGGKTCDFKRVVLHELGHALGLAHPDEQGQSVSAVMNSGATSHPVPQRLTDDDVAGIRAIYASDSVVVDGGVVGSGGGSTAQKDYSAGGALVDLFLLISLLLCKWLSLIFPRTPIYR